MGSWLRLGLYLLLGLLIIGVQCVVRDCSLPRPDWIPSTDTPWTPQVLSALSRASQEGHKQIVQPLLDNAPTSMLEETMLPPRRRVLRQTDMSRVQLLLEKGAKVSATEEHGDAALVYASQNGHERIVQLLLEKGAHVDATGAFDATALMRASQNGHEQIIPLLLEMGADIEATGKYGDTAPACASGNGHEQIVQLLEKGASIESGRWISNTPLLCVSRNGHK